MEGDQNAGFSCYERRRVRYQGRVQGVGFRASTREIARRHRVVGFVRNEPDGTVLAEVEGIASDIETFLGEVRMTLSRFIRGEDAASIPPERSESAFEIRA
jgi:acylphosphatase